MGTKPGFFSRVNQSVKETVSAIKQTASDIYHSKPVTMAKGAVEVLAGVAILALAIKGVMFFGTGTGVAFLGELASALPSVLSGAAVAFTATAQVFAVASVCFGKNQPLLQ